MAPAVPKGAVFRSLPRYCGSWSTWTEDDRGHIMSVAGSVGEQIIRDNLDLGRPDKVQMILQRRITRKTPSRFRTRVLTTGVIPTLSIDYKRTRIKQYFKEGRAIRTETTINDTRDFAIGKRLENLPALREIGLQAKRRLLDVQRISHDCYLGEDAFQQIHQPVSVGGQRAAALRFGDPRVLAILAVLVLFRLLPNGFTNRDMREHVSASLGRDFSSGQMTYDLRRLRLHGAHPTDPEDASIPSHRKRYAGGALSHSFLCSSSSSWPGLDPSRCRASGIHPHPPRYGEGRPRDPASLGFATGGCLIQA